MEHHGILSILNYYNRREIECNIQKQLTLQVVVTITKYFDVWPRLYVQYF